MKSAWLYRFRTTTFQLVLFVGIFGGLGISKSEYQFKFWYLILLFCVFILCFRKRNLILLTTVLLLAISFGALRGDSYSQKLEIYKTLEKQKITITVHAMNDAIYDKNKQLSFDANNITLADGRKLTGKVKMSGFGVNAVFQGDELRATGSFYHGFGAYQSTMRFASLELVAHHPTIISTIRAKFIAGMQTALPEPLAPFAMGILVGQRATLPEDVKEDFLKVGLTHIVAVSGYNLTIILHASQKMMGKRSKRISTLISIGLIAVFLLIAGASASIVRAAIVSMLSIWAGYYGRTFKPLNLIALAAVITAWANPVYIWSDLSWYLSFLAFYGVMVLSPLIQLRWPARWQQTIIGGVALESLCAEIMSVPFILYMFGQMSFIGLVANVMVVTLVPLAMLLSLIAGLGGMMFAPYVGWVAWPAVILLNYMLDTARWLADLPHIFIEKHGISLITMLIIYGVICLFCAVLMLRTKNKKPDIITDINSSFTKGAMA